jgi:hypothetical protein
VTRRPVVMRLWPGPHHDSRAPADHAHRRRRHRCHQPPRRGATGRLSGSAAAAARRRSAAAAAAGMISRVELTAVLPGRLGTDRQPGRSRAVGSGPVTSGRSGFSTSRTSQSQLRTIRSNSGKVMFAPATTCCQCVRSRESEPLGGLMRRHRLLLFIAALLITTGGRLKQDGPDLGRLRGLGGRDRPNSGVEIAGIIDLGAGPLTVKIDEAPHGLTTLLCREAFRCPLRPLVSGS